jgi:diguanylate cyclase (GGDEF)-like protein/PAS domain S-box-containing protein
MLLVITASFFFLSTRWFSAVLALVLPTWGTVVMVFIEPSPALIHYGFALLQTLVAALLINVLRIANLKRLESLRLHNERQNARLLLEVSEHERARQAFFESEEKYRSTMNAAVAGIYVIRDLAFDYVNPMMTDLFGYTAREMEDRLNLLDLIVPEERDVVRDELLQQMQGIYKAPMEVRCVRKDGSSFDATMWARVVEHRHHQVVVGTLMDITERKRAEQALRRINVALEARVSERTAALRRLNASLMEEIENRKSYEARLEYQAKYDSLTDLPNRALLKDRLLHALDHAHRNRCSVAVLFLDLDRFKLINDSLGHAAGDMLLQHVAVRLKASVRESDTVARLGGDEFVIVVENLQNEHGAILVANKILKKMEMPFRLDTQEFFMSCTIGISLFPANGHDPDTLLKQANLAMHRGKDSERNHVCFYTSEMNARVIEHLMLQNSLRQALDAEQFMLSYQPQVSLENGRVAGLEALVRWQHPRMGTVSPVKFIPLAEENGLIVPIGAWVLKQACAQVKAWQTKGLSIKTVAVNLSPRQFIEIRLPDLVACTLEETGLDAHCLELEITENLLMKDLEGSILTLRALKSIGVKLAIDDFGTGYSSLSYLKRLPIDRLKIDQSFVRDVNSNADDAAITQAIITLAHNLGLTVIAEGVENTEQIAFLSARHCDQVQGYLFSHPIPPEDIADFLMTFRPTWVTSQQPTA